MSETRDQQPRPDGGLPTDADEADRTGADLGRLGEEGGPIGLRLGRDPGNLGDEVPSGGDVTHPGPMDTGSGETPHM